MRAAVAVLLALVFSMCPLLAEDTASDTAKTATEPVIETAKITFDAQDAKPSEVIESLAKDSKEKILVESTVKRHVTFRVENVSLETALGALGKSGKFEWRKVYVDPESKLLEQPDRLSATVRLISGMGFPDVVIASSSTKKLAVHSEGEKAAKAAESKLVQELGLKPIYLITNDAAVAAKKTEEEDKESKAVDDYIDGTKKLMDAFINMTPEERERALVESLTLMDQVGPGYMSSVMQTMMDSDPALLKQLVGRQTQMLFGMDETARRRMLRLNMEASSMLTPEQMEMLKEDQKAIMEEIKSEHGGLPQAP